MTWTGVISFLPILIHLILGQYVNLSMLALEYLMWYFFFSFFVFGIYLLAYPASAACRRAQCCYRSCLKDYHETENWLEMEELRGGVGSAGSEALRMVNRESDLCWNTSHGEGHPNPETESSVEVTEVKRVQLVEGVVRVV